jgi:putative transposase
MAPPGAYFLTFSTWERTRLFVVEAYAKIFLQTLYGYRRQGSFQLHAFVLMPEHIHLLLTPANEVTLERVVQLIKGGYSHKFGSEFGRKKRSVGERVYGSSDSRLQGL